MKNYRSIIAMILTILVSTMVWGYAQEKVTNQVAGLLYRSDAVKEKEKKEYRFKQSKGKLILNVGHITIEGYNGDEVVISMLVERKEDDPRAAGLQGISGSGIKDNTNIGLNVTRDGENTSIKLVNRLYQDSIHLKVPRNLSLSLEGSGSWRSGLTEVKNIQGEIEGAITMGDVKLENVTGPITIKTTHGNVEASFASPVKGPVSLMSTLGFIDVALPIKTAANIEMATTLGELYAAQDFNIVNIPKEVTNKVDTKVAEAIAKKNIEVKTGGTTITANRVIVDGLISDFKFSGSPSVSFVTGSGTNQVKGTINGGGENIILKTTHGKIYLRKAEN